MPKSLISLSTEDLAYDSTPLYGRQLSTPGTSSYSVHKNADNYRTGFAHQTNFSAFNSSKRDPREPQGNINDTRK